MLVMLYTTGFTLIFFVFSIWIVGINSKPSVITLRRLNPIFQSRITMLILVLYSAVAVSYVVGVAFGWFGGLGDETKSAGQSLVQSLLKLVYEIRWFVLGMAFVLFIRRGSKVALGVLFAQVILNFGYALMYGGRGHALISLFIIATALLSRRTEMKKFMLQLQKFYWLILLAGLVVFMVLFVSTIRSQGVYNDNQLSISEVFDNSGEIILDLQDKVEDIFRGGIDRLTTSEITFIWIINDTQPAQSKGDYPLGSITDLRKMVPAFAYKWIFGSEKPRMTFNFWMSKYLLGRGIRTEFDLPIGRIAESYYALNWGGLSFAILYAVLFTSMYRYMWVQTNNFLLQSMYFWLLFAFIRLGAACMTNRLPIVIQVAILLSPIFFLLSGVKFQEASNHQMGGEFAFRPVLPPANPSDSNFHRP